MSFSPPSRSNTSKSFRRLLLPLFVPVTPLSAHSYKKRGGWRHQRPERSEWNWGVPHPVGKDDARNTGFSLCGVSQNGTHSMKLACRLGRPVLIKPVGHSLEAPRGSNAPDAVDIVDSSLQCFLSLTDFPRACLQKHPNVFYHLRAMFHLSTSVFYHLQKRRGGVRQLQQRMGVVAQSRSCGTGKVDLPKSMVPGVASATAS